MEGMEKREVGPLVGVYQNFQRDCVVQKAYLIILYVVDEKTACEVSKNI